MASPVSIEVHRQEFLEAMAELGEAHAAAQQPLPKHLNARLWIALEKIDRVATVEMREGVLWIEPNEELNALIGTLRAYRRQA